MEEVEGVRAGSRLRLTPRGEEAPALIDDADIRHLSVPRQLRYAVRGVEDDPEETWFLLHGYGQLAPRFLRYFGDLDDGSRLLVAPEGLHRHYLDRGERKVGASWMTSEDRLTDIQDYIEWLERLHDRVVGRVEEAGAPVEDAGAPVEAGGGPVEGGGPPVVTLGFSQGVHTLFRWLAFGRARIDTAVLWGSHLPPDLDPEEHADALRRARILLVAGDRDPHFGPDAVARAEERLDEAGIPFRTLGFEGGHRIDRDVLARIARLVREGG
ncbi:MAG TPA: hypothetical protein VKB18_07205 [Gemmatimonadota bacterium]|nr:hypothetical protein [Gemmatimonadota bacterium]